MPHITEQQAKDNLQTLVKKYYALSADDRKVMSEASVVRQFIDLLLRDVLGWPIEDTQRYRYEQVTQVGRPDMMLTPETGGVVYVEAKRFGKIDELELARHTIRGVVTPGQLALPGMAVDRTPEEQQAINYAFANNGTWAILSNFERLRLFNARRDWLVLSFEKPDAYLKDFELLWELSYQNVLTGSLDRLSNQRLTAEVDTDYLNFINVWRQKLAQDIVEHKRDNPWAFLPNGEVDLVTLRATVQRILDRLVIMRFAEDHLVLPPGTLRVLQDSGQTSYLVDVMDMLRGMFRKFDKIHNSALFSQGLADKAIFSEKTLLELVGKLYEARYRSMPADIMGNTYEQYLGKTLVRRNGKVETADNLETRKKQGSYYTPQVIVRYIVDNSLGRYLYGTENGKADGTPIPNERRKQSTEIRDLRVLDSACGSGSFLIYAYEVLNGFYESEKARLAREQELRVDELGREGKSPIEIRIETVSYKTELERINNHPRLILETHLYGVDLDPQAAEIAVVNLMMRGMERRHQEKRLPLILNQNVKVGNGLVGLRFNDPKLVERPEKIAELFQLRRELIETPHDTPAHYEIVSNLEFMTHRWNETLNAEFSARFGDDLSAVRPFNWGVEFPEVFYDQDGELLEKPGFTIILGNPPWEILKPDLREFYAQFDENIESHYSRAQAEKRIAELDAQDPLRRQMYERSTQLVGKQVTHIRESGDYTKQGRGDPATHKLFMERMYSLLRHEGRLGYVVPSGIYRDLGTKELREMLLDAGNIQYIYAFSNERGFFPGVHHDFRFALIGIQKGVQTDGFWSVFRFNPRVAVKPDELMEFLADRSRLIYVRRESLTKFSPDSLSVMEFQSRQDYQVAEKIYGNWPLLGETQDGQWQVKFTSEFHMTNDRDLFKSKHEGYLPLYEGKMIHQYNAYFDEPKFWIDESEGRQRFLSRSNQQNDCLIYQRYRLVYRDVANATNERTLIATIIPRNTFVGNTGIVETMTQGKEMLFLLAILNSFCEDRVIRNKVSTHVSMFYAYQLPLPRLTPGNPYFDAIVPRAARLTCTRAEFADLWREVMQEEWDESKGASDPAERQRLRDEIDALVARLYGLTRDEFDHILGTFPLVFPDTDAGRLKRSTLLDVFDRTAV